MRCRLFMVALILLSQAGAGVPGEKTFANPLFSGQDPWVVQWNGSYYYSESTRRGIRIRKSPTLTGLAQARLQTVWTASGNLTSIWAPEVHLVDGRWYVYFSADRRLDKFHRMYVVEGGADPMGPYSPDATMLSESSGKWAIDPDVFQGPDHGLYLIWSCADNENGGQPQSLCLAKMSDALHVGCSTVRIAKPTASWETRTAAIEEGPVGFVRNGTTYVTYSASASYTPNDYAVGLLTNATGNLMDAKAWVKTGPIFDRHGKTYGPGSIVFVPSLDHTETWSMYHAYDRLNCAQFACRSVRMQQIRWSQTGMPLLGYPFDPEVPIAVPSGDSAQAFRGSMNMLAWSVSAEVSGLGEYGIYPLYYDQANEVQMFVDPVQRAFGERATVAGVDRPVVSHPLPADFDVSASHTIRVDVSGARLFSFYLDGAMIDRQPIALDRGQVGVFGQAKLSNVKVTDLSSGWGDAQGDAAEGLPRTRNAAFGMGYREGSWDVPGAGSLVSTSKGEWNSIYRDNPLAGNYSVAVEAQASSTGEYGLIACHNDRENQLSLWVNPGSNSVELISVIAGTFNRRKLGPLRKSASGGFHKLEARRKGNLFTFFVDGSPVGKQKMNIDSGTPGLATAHGEIHFQSFEIHSL